MRKFLTATMAMAFAAAVASGAVAATSKTHHRTGGHSLSGTIEAYDAAAHTLTLKTSKGSTTFTLAPDAKVWAGSKSVAVDALASDTGAKATVSYSESGGQKTAKTVRVASATPKPAATTK